MSKVRYRLGCGNLFVMDNETAGILRLVGLIGLGGSFAVWALAERSGRRTALVFVVACAALLSGLIYFIAAMAAADSGAHRLLPRFP
jgi:hypothetical protein